MSQSSSKQVMSGLRSVKRDWSSNTLSSSQEEKPTRPQLLQPKTAGDSQKSMNAMERRLRAIQAALDDQESQESSTKSQASISSIPQKRPSPSDPPSSSSDSNKRRQLPSSWSSSSALSSNTSSTYKSSNLDGRLGRNPIALPQKKKSIEVTTTTIVKRKAASTATSHPATVFLSSEQTHILKLVERGESVFYTGSAGTGKSVLLREIIKVLRRKFSKADDAVAITASTGIAACNIGGVTIHSFAGIGLGLETVEVLANRIRKNKKSMARWLRTKVLIIDEVSMMDGALFDKLAKLGSQLRKIVEPFGGIQLIVTGDFFQLPPVSKDGATKFAFDADMWKVAIKRTFNLTQVFRQKDPEFVDMLNEMRFGRLSETSIKKFRALSRPIEDEDGISATELFPRRDDVERSNRTRMGNIDSMGHTFDAIDGGTMVGSDQGNKLLTNFMCPEKLVLKVGAQVMLIKNTDETLVNGSIGTIVSFQDAVTFANETGADMAAKPNSKVGKEPKAGGAIGRQYPVVEFLTSKRRTLIVPEPFKVELPNGEIQVSRTQLPIILAWAMSIHKSQGQTLERVKVDLGRIFEKGQAYVALSRATSLEGLQVLNFDPNKVKVHPRVVQWSETLETVPVN